VWLTCSKTKRRSNTFRQRDVLCCVTLHYKQPPVPDTEVQSLHKLHHPHFNVIKSTYGVQSIRLNTQVQGINKGGQQYRKSRSRYRVL
jgi:hypothetical protein